MTKKPPPRILALDVATNTGWAYGVPGTMPRGGSVRFASPGSSNGTVGVGCLNWFAEFLKVSPVDALYFEAPFDPRQMGGKTTFATARILLGLPFLIEMLAEAKSIFRVREVLVGDARKHFVGRNPRGDDGKAAVQLQCRALGWSFQDDNAADALAVWSFACAVEAPGVAQAATTPLFNPRRGHNGAPPLEDRPRRPIDDVEDIQF